MSAARSDGRAALRAIARLLEGEYGVPRAGRSGDLVGTLVGTVLSQHTTDAGADQAYRRLRERFPSWSALAGAGRRPAEGGSGCCRRG